MNTTAAINTLVTMTTTLNNLAAGAAKISALIQKAQVEGRTEFTPQEWATITQADDAARSVLVDAISNALLKAGA